MRKKKEKEKKGKKREEEYIYIKNEDKRTKRAEIRILKKFLAADKACKATF